MAFTEIRSYGSGSIQVMTGVRVALEDELTGLASRPLQRRGLCWTGVLQAAVSRCPEAHVAGIRETCTAAGTQALDLRHVGIHCRQRRHCDARDRRPAPVTALLLAHGSTPYAELRAIWAPLSTLSFSRREWLSA